MSYIKNISDQELVIELKRFMENAPKIYLPSVSIDTVIFSFHDEQLKVLLLRFGNTRSFMLPGGYIEKHENLDDAALRILQERTGLENIYLEQFYTSGNNARFKEGIVLETFKK